MIGNVSKRITSVLRQSIGVDLRLTSKERKKRKIDKKKSEDAKLDLERLSIIDVSSDDEKLVVVSDSNYKNTGSEKIPFFDYMPDEVCLNIFRNLSEQKAARMAEVCKRFAAILNEETFWEEKAKGWIHLHVSKSTVAADALKEYYLKKYQENQKMEERKMKEAKQQEIKEKLDQETKSVKNYFTAYWSLGLMEIPTLIALLLWTIFLALRNDEYIFWNYHLVFLPIYIALLQIFCGLFTTDVVYAYFKEKKNTHTQFALPNFSVNGTASLVYEEMTPLWKYIRRKGSAYIWWMTVTAFFVLLAESLNQEGLFGAEWCLVAVLVRVALMSICFFSWRPSSSEDKFFGGMGFFIFFLTVSWIILFIWTKWEFLADFDWYSSFSPWWIIAIASFFALIVAWVIYLLHLDSSDFWLFTSMIVTATVAFFTISAFLVLLALNLEALYLDKPLYPWIVVAIPMIIFEVFSIVACCVLLFLKVWE